MLNGKRKVVKNANKFCCKIVTYMRVIDITILKFINTETYFL